MTPEEPAEFWAFWSYDRFPYVLSGKVSTFLPDGRVKVLAYTGMTFTPLYLARGDHGARLHRKLHRLRAAWQVHEEFSRNAARVVAAEALADDYFPPIPALSGGTGWIGDAYVELFRRQLEQEKDA